MEEAIHTAICQKPIAIVEAFSHIADRNHGGSNVFQGTVRQMNLGRHVIGISYDVADALALKTFNTLSLQALQQWGKTQRIYIAHAKGRLNVGDISVLIAVSAPHRDEAFKSCRYLIEGIKHQSPIWKQEHYSDGDSQWVKGHALCTGANHEIL